MNLLDETHDPNKRSWVASANGHPDFPIQNLPLGVFSPPGGGERRRGTAIGDSILDLSSPHVHSALSGDAVRAAEAASGPTLNELFALGSGPRQALRQQLSALLAEAAGNQTLNSALHLASDCTLHLPA